MSRPPWGHTSRRCLRCDKVGPRVAHGFGYIHAYCRTEDEARTARKRQRDRRKGTPA